MILFIRSSKYIIYTSSIPNVAPYAYCACSVHCSDRRTSRRTPGLGTPARGTSEILHRRVGRLYNCRRTKNSVTGRTDETLKFVTGRSNSCMAYSNLICWPANFRKFSCPGPARGAGGGRRVPHCSSLRLCRFNGCAFSCHRFPEPGPRGRRAFLFLPH